MHSSPVTRPIPTEALSEPQLSYRAWSQVPKHDKLNSSAGYRMAAATARILPPTIRRTPTEAISPAIERPASIRAGHRHGTSACVAALMFAATMVAACLGHVPSRIDALVDRVDNYVDVGIGVVARVVATTTIGHSDHLWNVIALVAA